MSKNLKICFDRVVPPEDLPDHGKAHQDAVSAYNHHVKETLQKKGIPAGVHLTHEDVHNVLPDLNANADVQAARMAIINLKAWDKGHALRCRFLDGSPTQRKRVEEKAQMWEKYANVKMVFGDDPKAEVRISFAADPGSWSALGKDCLITKFFPKNEPTMNYGWLEDNTEDDEYERVVVHEFGHALGCIHEHQNPKVALNWDRDAVYKEFSGPPNNWSKADIDSNILQKYSPKGITSTAFDDKSIMLYQFDAELFTDKKPTPLNKHLSKKDESMIGKMYPK
jgi:hypothetical protein